MYWYCIQLLNLGCFLFDGLRMADIGPVLVFWWFLPLHQRDLLFDAVFLVSFHCMWEINISENSDYHLYEKRWIRVNKSVIDLDYVYSYR